MCWRSFFRAAAIVTVSLTLLFTTGTVALAQSTPPPPPDTEDRPHPSEPDFKVISLPTTLQMPALKLTFAMTHRFNGNLRNGSFGDQLEGLFGLDSGASIGLELRFAPIRRVQVAVFRTNIDRVIQFTGKFDLFRQRGGMPVAVSPVLSIEGALNFRERYTPAIGATVSRMLHERVAVYAVPMWAHDTVHVGAERDTTFIGLGGRLQIRPRTFIVVEATPRLGGYTPGETMFGFAIEKRVGGHVFQLNFCNSQATTLGGVARGGLPKALFLGFNLTRKFY